MDVMLHTEVYMVYVAVHIVQGYTQPANDCQTVKPVQSLAACTCVLMLSGLQRASMLNGQTTTLGTCQWSYYCNKDSKSV